MGQSCQDYLLSPEALCSPHTLIGRRSLAAADCAILGSVRFDPTGTDWHSERLNCKTWTG